MQSMESDCKTALIIVDMQNDFMEFGSLPVTDGSKTVPVVNELRKTYKWDMIALTSDWHPQDHMSFQVNNPGSKLYAPFEIERLGGITQVMWPVHCVQGTEGSQWHKDLVTEETDFIVRKGDNKDIEMYSGFGTEKHPTPLYEQLKSEGITQVVCVGLAYDYCVGSTAFDAAKHGFKTFLVQDATKPVAPETQKAMCQKLVDAGVTEI